MVERKTIQIMCRVKKKKRTQQLPTNLCATGKCLAEGEMGEKGGEGYESREEENTDMS